MLLSQHAQVIIRCSRQISHFTPKNIDISVLMNISNQSPTTGTQWRHKISISKASSILPFTLKYIVVLFLNDIHLGLLYLYFSSKDQASNPIYQKWGILKPNLCCLVTSEKIMPYYESVGIWLHTKSTKSYFSLSTVETCAVGLLCTLSQSGISACSLISHSTMHQCFITLT